MSEVRLTEFRAIKKTEKGTVYIAIDHPPTIDAVEVVYARWEAVELYCNHAKEFRCSGEGGCGSVVEYGNYTRSCDYDYCPNCGARMDADREYAHQKELNEKNEHNCRRLTEAERVIFNDALESVYGMTGCSMDGQGEGDAE